MASTKKTSGRKGNAGRSGALPVSRRKKDADIAAPTDGLGSRLGDDAHRWVSAIETRIEALFKSMHAATGIELTRLHEQAMAKIAIAKSLAASLRSGALEQLGQSARSSLAETDRYLRGNPWRAVGIGAVLGVTASALLTRRNPA